MSTIPVHDLELHHETRGSGPPVLFISGATGDAGHWTEVGEELSADFTVISYDRRGNSRSPAPPGWTATSIAEQADDAAALLEGLGTAPCAVVGNSLGAIIACALVEQHPGLLHTAVLHEPPLLSIVTHGDQIGDDLQSMIGEAVQEGGFPLAMDRFLRGVAGDDVIDALEPALRTRMLTNGQVFFEVELPAMSAYLPDPELLRRTGVTLLPAAGVDNRDTYFGEATRWLADGLGVAVHELSGAHGPYFDRPAVFADELRILLNDKR